MELPSLTFCPTEQQFIGFSLMLCINRVCCAYILKRVVLLRLICRHLLLWVSLRCTQSSQSSIFTMSGA